MTRDPDNPKKTRDLSRASATAVGTPNPQGKGQIGFLLDWDYSTPRGIVVKRSAQVLADYFTSLLVLSAAFKFKPAYNKDYYLYFERKEWNLSLISPDDWNTLVKRRAFAGVCNLHDDSTWSISPSDNLSQPGPLADAVSEFYDRFAEKLQSPRSLEEDLPLYEGSLPYWQRIFAAALSRSLRASLTRGGQLNRSAIEWLERVPTDANALLGAPDA